MQVILQLRRHRHGFSEITTEGAIKVPLYSVKAEVVNCSKPISANTTL